MPRSARIVIPHVLHHITQRGNRKEVVFFDDEDRLYFRDRLQFYSSRAGLGLALDCLMDNHTHLLAVPEHKESFEMTFKPLHMQYSQYLNKKFGRSGVNWQGRYFSSPLDDSHAWNAFEYVALNPVRAQLSQSLDLYKWSSAKALLTGAPDPLLTADLKWLRMGRLAISEILKSPNFVPDQEAFRQIATLTLKNLPIGSESFIAELESQTGRVLRPKPMGRPPKKKSE